MLLRNRQNEMSLGCSHLMESKKGLPMMTMTLPFSTGTNILESLRFAGVVDISMLDLVAFG